MKRRTLRMLCALLLCLGLLPVTAAAETQGSFREGGLPFTDVDQEDWYAEAVGYVYARGLMSGTGADTFGPGAAASRAMMVTSLWRMAGSPVVNYAMRFADVPQGRWYSEAVRWAASEGIAAGCGDAFGTDDPVTREQLAVMLWQFAQNQGWDATSGSGPSGSLRVRIVN